MKKKSKFKTILVIIVVLCLIGFLGMAVYLNITYSNPFYDVYGNYISPDGKYRLEVLYYKDEHDFLPTRIRIKAYKNQLFGGLKNNTYTTRSFDTLSPEKIDVSWDADNKSSIIITRRKQAKEYLEIIFDDDNATIRHKEMDFNVLQYDDSSNVFDHKIFEVGRQKINIYYLNTKVIDSDGNDAINSFDDFEFFYQTLEYKINRKKIERDYIDEAYVYKADNFTFIECHSPREYVIGKKDMKYKPEYCDYNNDLEIGNS